MAESKTCTCDRLASYTFDSACPVHGDGTVEAARREAINRGDWPRVDELDAQIEAAVTRAA